MCVWTIGLIEHGRIGLISVDEIEKESISEIEEGEWVLGQKKPQIGIRSHCHIQEEFIL